MSRISPEKEILYISKVIDKNLHYYDTLLKDKGFLSENILSQLRNLVEDVVILINNNINGLDLDCGYDNVNDSFDAIKNMKQYKFLSVFHEFLQGTASHYTPSEDGAERLVKYYFRYICMVKNLLRDEFGIDIINNIDLFPIYDDKLMKINYDIICDKIEKVHTLKGNLIKGKFYVEKCNAIYSNGNIYYEITLSKATDYKNKFERLTFYSKLYIPDNYSINIFVIDDKVELKVGLKKLKIITDYKISIRICELKNIFRIFGEVKKFDDGYKEYRNLMQYLRNEELTIKGILCLEEKEYRVAINIIQSGADNHYISNMIDKMRYIIKNNKAGCNLIRYLTTKTRNLIIKNQISHESNWYFNNLFISKKSGMFDAMPFAMSLHNHNPSFRDLIAAIDDNGREDELLYYHIRNNTENNDELYTPIDEIQYFDNIPQLVQSFNQKMQSRIIDSNSILVLDKGFISIKEYEINSIKIIKTLNNYSIKKESFLNNVVNFYMDEISNYELSSDKLAILKNIFKNGSLALIYGPAGTGKTRMIEVISNAFNNYKKCIISNTTTAVTNISNRLEKNENLHIMTIKNYLKKFNEECDLLIIDECSMVSNKDMIKILNKQEYKALVLVGDIYQIESIEYGNWFRICSRYFKDGISYELEMTHRTTDEDLLELWNCVRENNKKAIRIMVNKEYSQELTEDIFTRTSDEEIILCLNYDGMYGINNINQIMQNSNCNEEHNFGVDTFKIGDPVLFNDCPRFIDVIHNNLKGIIKNIEEDENSVWFSIEVDANSINTIFMPEDIYLIQSDKADKIILKFKVNEFKDLEDDENKYDHIIPFNLSYAISIHKAQGLEYDSVKVVITSNIEDNITKEIFYTAITRAKRKLKVYWSSESQDKIFEGFDKKESKRDLAILNQKIKKAC